MQLKQCMSIDVLINGKQVKLKKLKRQKAGLKVDTPEGKDKKGLVTFKPLYREDIFSGPFSL